MNENENNAQNGLKTPWYKKKRYLIPVAILFSGGLINAFGSDPEPVSQVVPIQQVQVVKPQGKYVAPQVQVQEQVRLSNDNYYTNTRGNEVHSPAYSDTVPSGASAQCGDGTYSFSQSRRGTCSHHGGVGTWY